MLVVAMLTCVYHSHHLSLVDGDVWWWLRWHVRASPKLLKFIPRGVTNVYITQQSIWYISLKGTAVDLVVRGVSRRKVKLIRIHRLRIIEVCFVPIHLVQFFNFDKCNVDLFLALDKKRHGITKIIKIHPVGIMTVSWQMLNRYFWSFYRLTLSPRQLLC